MSTGRLEPGRPRPGDPPVPPGGGPERPPSRYPLQTMAEQPKSSQAPAPTAGRARAKSGIPRNPGRHEMGMKATLTLPEPRDRRALLRPPDLHGLPDLYSELEPEEIFRRAEGGEIEPAKMQRLISGVIESGPLGSTIEHVVFTLRHQRVSRTLVAPAGPPPGRRRLRPAEPALRLLQAGRDDASGHDRGGGSRAAGSLPRSRSTARSACTASCWRPASPARTPASSSPMPRAPTS